LKRQTTGFLDKKMIELKTELRGPALTDVTVQCKLCGNPATIRVSRSEKNPGRKYWACTNFSYCSNKFIDWVKVFQEKQLPGLPEAINQETMNAFLKVTAEQIVNIRSFKQRSPEWLQARVGRLTASNFGAAAGFNPFQSPSSCYKSCYGDHLKATELHVGVQ